MDLQVADDMIKRVSRLRLCCDGGRGVDSGVRDGSYWSLGLGSRRDFGYEKNDTVESLWWVKKLLSWPGASPCSLM